MSFLTQFQKASNAVLKQVLGVMVGRDDICDAIGYFENAGPPTALVPAFIGQVVFDTTNSVFYKATGLTAANWSTLAAGTLSAGTPGVGVTAQEKGDGSHHLTVLTLGPGCVLPNIPGGASLGVGTLIYTFPAGAQVINSTQVNVGITQTTGHINANTPTVGLGSVVASGVIAVLSGTATFQNMNVGKAAANCTGTPTVQTVNATASPFTYITDVGGVKSVFFNAAAAWAATGDPGALLSGTVSIDWDTLS